MSHHEIAAVVIVNSVALMGCYLLSGFCMPAGAVRNKTILAHTNDVDLAMSAAAITLLEQVCAMF